MKKVWCTNHFPRSLHGVFLIQGYTNSLWTSPYFHFLDHFLHNFSWHLCKSTTNHNSLPIIIAPLCTLSNLMRKLLNHLSPLVLLILCFVSPLGKPWYQLFGKIPKAKFAKPLNAKSSLDGPELQKYGSFELLLPSFLRLLTVSLFQQHLTWTFL